MKYTVKLEWDREGMAEVIKYVCDVCGDITEVLSVDTSDEEYGSMHICKKCIDKLFEGNNYCFRCKSYHPKHQDCLLPR